MFLLLFFNKGGMRNVFEAQDWWFPHEVERESQSATPHCQRKPSNRKDGIHSSFCYSGLLVSLLDNESQEDLRANKNLGVYKGALYENFVGEALVKSGYQLYYYKRGDGTLEEDFFLRTMDHLVPVEVKANAGKSKSLQTLISSNKYPDIAFGIKLSANNIGYSERVYTLPYFCTFLLKRWLKDFKPNLD